MTEPTKFVPCLSFTKKSISYFLLCLNFPQKSILYFHIFFLFSDYWKNLLHLHQKEHCLFAESTSSSKIKQPSPFTKDVTNPKWRFRAWSHSSERKIEKDFFFFFFLDLKFQGLTCVMTTTRRKWHNWREDVAFSRNWRGLFKKKIKVNVTVMTHLMI